MKQSIWKPKFIQALRNSANVRAACHVAGIDRTTAYKARLRSAEFARQWDEALEDAVDGLEGAAWQRARDGVKREDPIFYQGEQIGSRFITEYSDGLMTLLLKANRPEKYKDKFELQIKDAKQRAETAIEQVMRDTGLNRQQAIEHLAAHIKNISELVN